MADLRYLSNVVTLTLDEDKCTGCGMCVQVCPQGVFSLEAAKVRFVDRDGCMECGACAGNCPMAAISVKDGVGCASGVIMGALRGTEPVCDCAQDNSCCG